MTSPFQEKITKVYNALTNKINSSISTHNSSSSSHQDLRNSKISYGQVDSTSTSTVFTATVPNLNELVDGTTVMLQNGYVTSAEGFTLEINGLGAKPVYSNLANATRDTTIFNINYTMLFVYDSTRVDGGCWICYRGYDSNTNTVGYQIRTNSTPFTATDKGYKYRLWLETDGNKYMPVNTSTSTNATANRSSAMNTREFWIGGKILYNATNGTTNANATMSATTLWQQYTLTLGYSFNNTGSALTLTPNEPLYMVAKAKGNGKAQLNTPYYTQTLPSIEDGLIYIYLGHMYSATALELALDHPVYEYKNNSIRLYRDTYSMGEVDDLLDGKSDTNHTHSGYASSTHSHGNISNTGIMISKDSVSNKNVVTDSTGKIIVEDKPSIPSKTSNLTNDSNFISTSSTNGLIKNDGSIDTSSYITSSAITNHNSSSSAHSSLFSGKADSVHNHLTSDITDFPAIPRDLEDLTDNTNILHFNDYIAYDDMSGVPLSDFNNDLTKLEGVSGYTLIQEDTDNGTQIAFNEKIIYDYVDTEKVYYNVNGNWIDPDNEIATKGDIPVITGKENASNKVKSTSGWSSTTTDDHYPSEKLVKDSLDDKISKSNTSGLVKNDGSIDTNSYITISSVPTQTSDLTNDGSDGTSTYAETGDVSTAITTHDSSMYSHQDIRTSLNQKEVTSNKVSSITSNTGSTIKYPNVKAIEDYAEPKKSPLAISQLNSLISSASNNGTIVLDNDYVNGTSNQNIYIENKNITIIGNGHTIDSNNKLISFILLNATVTIYDCNFINNTSTSSSSSLFKVTTAGTGTVSLNNCTFKNSSIKYYLISIESGTLNIRDCLFYNNAQTGSRYILYIKNSNLDIKNTIFENNTLKPISITNTNATSRSQTITECIFNNNVSAITEDSSSESYKQVVLKNNYFVQAGDTITGCTNNNYLTQHQDITGKENTSNKVTSWTATVTDTNYPSEKLVKDSLDAKLEVNDLLDLIYPVGSIYMEKDTASHSVCPIQTTLGGTWTRIQNRFLYASENAQGVGTTGGSADAVVVEHNHTQKAHTHIQDQHRHQQGHRSVYNASGQAVASIGYNAGTSGGVTYYTSYTTPTNQNTTAENNATGVDGTGKNMPPYIVVNVWERTA